MPALDPAVRDPLWNLRRAAMPLLYGMPGDRKPITFVEDTACRPERLPEFVARFRELLRRHGTDGAFYGHASVGCLHIRPVLNLKDPGDVARMRRITEEVTDLVLEYGGSLSAASTATAWRAASGTARCSAPTSTRRSARSKRLFDPNGLLNPGKIVDAPPMTENLRYAAGLPPRRAGDGLRLPQAGGLPALGRDVQRQRRVPQDAGRDDVPVVPGDARREATARAAGPTPCG